MKKKKLKREIKKLKRKIKSIEVRPEIRTIGFDYLFNFHDDNEYEDEEY